MLGDSEAFLESALRIASRIGPEKASRSMGIGEFPVSDKTVSQGLRRVFDGGKVRFGHIPNL